MGRKKEELENALLGKGCLGKAADDEPVFILRAQDKLAPDIIREWANRLYQADPTSATVKKRDEARILADQMEAWPNRKIPD